jgi:WD40 repeat protein
VDGTLALFRTSDWALLKSLKGHSGRVNHVDVHPTGRVALSVGKDATLRMWDLMRGRGAASLALGTGEWGALSFCSSLPVRSISSCTIYLELQVQLRLRWSYAILVSISSCTLYLELQVQL